MNRPLNISEQNKLYKYMRLKNITQTSISRKLNVSQFYISKICTGKQNITDRIINQFNLININLKEVIK